MAWYEAEKLRDHPDVTAIIADADESQRAIMQAVRDKVAADPKTTEFIAWGVPCYWRDGPICYTSPAKKHVTLGFFHGLEIGDGLVGTGKSPIGKFTQKLGAPLPPQFDAWLAKAYELAPED